MTVASVKTCFGLTTIIRRCAASHLPATPSREGPISPWNDSAVSEET